jgi:hypothetical protein
MSEMPCGITPSESDTVSAIEATSPPPLLPPLLVAVVDAIACAVSSYSSRVGWFDDEQAAVARTKLSKVMLFMEAFQQQAADQITRIRAV